MLLREAIAEITWISRILFQLLKSSVSSVFSTYQFFSIRT